MAWQQVWAPRGERPLLWEQLPAERLWEPERVFEPGDSMGLGLGLTVCYGIVHEHGGEISAFNLHPHGAAVAVELPLDGADKKSEVVAGERAYSASV